MRAVLFSGSNCWITVRVKNDKQSSQLLNPIMNESENRPNPTRAILSSISSRDIVRSSSYSTDSTAYSDFHSNILPGVYTGPAGGQKGRNESLRPIHNVDVGSNASPRAPKGNRRRVRKILKGYPRTTILAGLCAFGTVITYIIGIAVH